MNKPAAIYARVSSDRQKENHTIASQTAALIEYAQKNQYSVPPEWVFQDEGYSGAILVRPGLEALRDLAAEGQMRESSISLLSGRPLSCAQTDTAESTWLADIQRSLAKAGLKLAQAKGPGQFLVIDRVEKPSGN